MSRDAWEAELLSCMSQDRIWCISLSPEKQGALESDAQLQDPKGPRDPQDAYDAEFCLVESGRNGSIPDAAFVFADVYLFQTPMQRFDRLLAFILTST